MGSSSYSSSSTNYTNTPVTQEDVTNPVNLVNSSARFGSDINVGGALSIVNNTDAQTVGAAFDFGSKLVQVVADITRQNNASNVSQAVTDTKDAATGTTTAAAAFDWTQYKTELMIGAGIVAWWLWGRKK
jgi:hypothetical protein